MPSTTTHGPEQKKKSTSPRVNLQPVEEKGIDTSHSLSKNEQDMANSLFRDKRKKRQKN